MERFDVIILGGGLLGSATAMHLAARGVKSIAVLDVDLGGRYSSSELNAGGVRATWRSEMNIALALPSIEFFESVKDEIGFDQVGYLWMYDEAGWPAAQEAMVGREVGVLYEKAGRLAGQMVGKSDHLHAVHVHDPEGRPGELVRVRISASSSNSLAGVRIS